MSDQPKDEPLVDADDFVGEPPAGDANLDDFVSNDQSDPATGKSDDESEDES
jgi:hypothetical protein